VTGLLYDSGEFAVIRNWWNTKIVCKICIGLILMAGFGSQVRAQDEIAPGVSPPLVLTEAIPLAGVQGRFDHFGFDRKNQLFVAALGNNSVEVIDISARTRVHSITGIPNPPGGRLRTGDEETLCGQQ
jgi:hypothetical protein